MNILIAHSARSNVPLVERRHIQLIRRQFALDWYGIHGAPHWARVYQNGLRLADATGANARVVALFAFFHDSCRLDDRVDPGHGARAARFVRAVAGREFNLSASELELLVLACEQHSEGRVQGDVTVLTCWDADRLDLGRVGQRPDPRRLCTAAARDPGLIEWACRRACARRQHPPYDEAGSFEDDAAASD